MLNVSKMKKSKTFISDLGRASKCDVDIIFDRLLNTQSNDSGSFSNYALKFRNEYGIDLDEFLIDKIYAKLVQNNILFIVDYDVYSDEMKFVFYKADVNDRDKYVVIVLENYNINDESLLELYNTLDTI